MDFPTLIRSGSFCFDFAAAGRFMPDPALPLEAGRFNTGGFGLGTPFGFGGDSLLATAFGLAAGLALALAAALATCRSPALGDNAKVVSSSDKASTESSAMAIDGISKLSLDA